MKKDKVNLKNYSRKRIAQIKDWASKGNERHYKFPYKKLYGIILRSAKARGISVDLTYEQYVKFAENKYCHYCHTELEWVKHGETASKTNTDRKNNDLGYTIKNCVPCCLQCNLAKSYKYSYKDWYGMTEYFRKKRPRDD